MAPSISTAMLLLLPLMLLVSVVLIVYPNDFALQALLSSPSCQHNASRTATDVLGVAVDFRLLIGVLTLPGRYERRSLIRTVYALQQASLPAHVVVDVRFVFCRVASEEVRVLVALEAMRYGDVVELDCEENMDNGKTYAYFSSLPALFGGGSAYDFVMKADDDTFFRLPQLAESLGRAPREDLYYGCRVPCNHRRAAKDEYMSGMGYVLSWDLVEWIAAADMIRNQTAGPEDRTLRQWFGLGDGGKAKNWVDAKPAIYGFPDPKDSCSHELVPDTVAVHKLKNNQRWAAMLSYFNFTAGLQPSNFFRNV